jgi:ABC-type phosphate transport system substrate-binding protein
MRTMNRVTVDQAEQFINTHFGQNFNKVEINYGAGGKGKRIEYFMKGICIGSYIVAFGIFEYMIH